MNIATVGTSWITEKFISACKYTGRVNVLYCYSRDIEKANEFAERNGIEAFTDSFDEIADNDRIDAVYIASPNVFHYEQTKFFLSKGKNVICEKPATSTEEQYSELCELADNMGVFYTEAIMSLNTPAFETLKNAIEKAGTIRNVNITYCQLSSKYPAFTEGKNPNIFNPEMHAGCLMDIGVYNVYLAAGLFGMPEKIQSSAEFLSSGADACGNAILSYPDKSVALVYSKVAQGYAPSEFYGDNGTVQVDAVSQCTGIRFVTKDNSTELVRNAISRDEVMSGEINFLCDLIEGKKEALEKYPIMRNTAATVRRITDIIKKQNSFPF